jgi:hypothetical protein
LLPAQFLAARTLVELSDDDARLAQLLKKVREEDEALRSYVGRAEYFGWDSKQALFVGLVDRAFRGAWEKLGLPGVVYDPNAKPLLQTGEAVRPEVAYRDPRDVLRQYLYGRHRASVTEGLLEEKGREEKERARRSAAEEVNLGGWTSYVQWAERTYLGEPGIAAREFRFVP